MKERKKGEETNYCERMSKQNNGYTNTHTQSPNSF